jgi:hypothetical protein
MDGPYTNHFMGVIVCLILSLHQQTAPLHTPRSQLTMWHVGRKLIQQYGITYLFRGLGITLIRAFPVNGTIFPIYELTLQQVKKWEGTQF